MNKPPADYNFSKNEKKWQKAWDKAKLFDSDDNSKLPSYYVLEMFPYPSGRIHMGHLRNYTIGDVVARFKKANGFNVLHPMGWDSFGLPAENAAIENGVHPAKWTYENIGYMRNQLKSIGFSYDWSREFATCDKEYYKHEQKIFLDFLKHGLAYQKEAMVNWDPVDNTVLANEQVVDGCGWRSGVPVERKKLRQWFLKISDFAEDLLESLKTLDKWPDKVKVMQERWIGKSEGLRIFFDIKDSDEKLEVYTTRPDTIFGASFCAIASNHPIATKLADKNPEILKFIEECNKLGMSEEVIEKTEKKGFDTDIKIIHPFNSKVELPLYIANFVLMDYGTGAIFGCPAHDQRDLDFANKYNLKVTQVISNGDDIEITNVAYSGVGKLINSSFLDDLTIADAKKSVIDKFEEADKGKRTVNYRLRDWGVSRQRYWGCPIPIIYCDDCGSVPVPEEQLPVTLPEDVDLSIAGNPLDNHLNWKHTNCPKCGKPAIRETDTFDTFFESSWYFARYCTPNAQNGIDKEICDKWLPVDQYIGGIEHAVLHLLYARFFTHALCKVGRISVKEPFAGLLTQGMVCHETYKDENGRWLFPNQVNKTKDGCFADDGSKVAVGRIIKMSKSKKNVVDPASIIDNYGADTARLFMISDSPPERDLEWSESGVEGAWRYINKLWRFVSSNLEILHNDAERPSELSKKSIELLKITNKTIKCVTDDLSEFRFNKALARIRELTNAIFAFSPKSEDEISVFNHSVKSTLLILQPITPHLSDELWQLINKKDEFIINQPWPKAEDKYLIDDTVTVVLQLNGKIKAKIDIAKDTPKDKMQEMALNNESLTTAIAGKQIKKVIVVPNRLVNVVA